jgi:predicted nucleic acid-binding Zn ribbon protein
MLEHMAQRTCPHCGASIESSRTVCPNCRVVLKKKNPLTPYLAIAGLVVLVVVVVAFVMTSPVSGPGTAVAQAIAVQPTSAGESIPSQPTCTIAITGAKAPPSSIRLEFMTSTCSAGEVTGLKVSVNGAQAGTLGTSPGASKIFAGTSGTNSVVVTAHYANGADAVVYQTVL